MRKVYLIISLALLSLPAISQTDSLAKKLDSLSVKKDSAGAQVNNTQRAAYNEQTKITFKTYFILLGSNMKQEFTKPFHMNKNQWAKFGFFAVATGALMLADEPMQKEALRFRNKNTWALDASRYITNTGGTYELITLGAIGSYGYLFRNKKMRNTTLLASQAYITGTITETVAKHLFGRTRPSYYPDGTEAEPRFRGPFNSANSSFPSGHATLAFAAATVYAMEYKSTVWVPILAYTSASLISASRITENKHWTTDVFVGAALGMLIGRHVVNNYHRYAKLQSAPAVPGEKKPAARKDIFLNLQVQNGHFQPGLVYHFQ